MGQLAAGGELTRWATSAEMVATFALDSSSNPDRSCSSSSRSGSNDFSLANLLPALSGSKEAALAASSSSGTLSGSNDSSDASNDLSSSEPLFSLLWKGLQPRRNAHARDGLGCHTSPPCGHGPQRTALLATYTPEKTSGLRIIALFRQRGIADEPCAIRVEALLAC